MIAYAALSWAPDDEDGDCLAGRLATTLERAGWDRTVDEPRRIVLLRGSHSTSVVRLIDDDTVLIGHVFDKQATMQGRVETLQPPDPGAPFDLGCAWWCDHGWGAYVAIHHDRNDAFDLFRDPVGMLDCLTWTHGRLRIVTSAPETLVAHAPPNDVAIDWQRVASLLRFPSSAGEALPFTGVETVAPGRRLRVSSAGREVQTLWSPARQARGVVAADVAGILPGLVDACVAAWCSTSTRAVGELSGGLDSAIVASGVTRLSEPLPTAWFNYHAVDREGDERRYARAVADRLGIACTETLRDHAVVDAELVATMPLTLRPAIASLSLFHDADLARRGEALGADMLLTGQGGDALFFQAAAPAIAADLRTAPGGLRDRLRTARDLALWTDQSIWSVLADWARAYRHPAPFSMPACRHDLVDPVIPVDAHPTAWMTDATDLPPAKQLQILNLAAARAAFGASWCSQAMRVVHPLMSQPLLEQVLPIPALALTEGRRDRAQIRGAYRDRLPAVLIERRGKGSLSPFYGRMLAASVPFLRGYLLDGLLVGHHLLVRDRLEAMLDADHLMRTNCYTEIIVAVMMEQWARGWSARLAGMGQGAAAGAGVGTFAKRSSNQANTRA
jgi:asparagine synthase (glutamine-hydrolysing)